MESLIKPNRLPNLTSLRFILALIVIIYHVSNFSKNRGFPFYNDLAIFNKGTEAVFVFFSLSGFLIIKQLFSEKKETNTINLKAFYTRRALRIFPLYYLVLIIGFLYYRQILPYFGFDYENNYNLINGILLSISFFPNIFSTYSPGGIIEILWSIGIEEQFYLFIAPLILLLPLKRVILFLSAFTILYFLIFFSEQIIFFREYNMMFFYFSFGGICSILLNNNLIHIFIKRMRFVILLICLVFFFTNIFKNNFNNIFYTLFSTILFGFTVSALAIKPIKILENKAMIYLGKISYGIYMYHAIMIQFVGFIYLRYISKFEFNNTLNILLINSLIILTTIIISHFSFKYYESYFLNFKEKFRIKKKS
jgi:peptidoglycan/LPS O-acetylase OafA/YrhL